MKLYTFTLDDEPRVGLEHRGRLIDVRAAAAVLSPPDHTALDGDMVALLRRGDRAFAALRQLHARLETIAPASTFDPWRHEFDDVTLLAPVPRPGKIVCAGINYLGHLDENPKATRPTEPFFFAKMPSAVVGPGATIRRPSATQQLDYEVELAVVIGRKLSRADAAEALAAVAGYTILHDVSARDVQFKDNQITLGKNFDTFCPMGPCLVTADEIPDPAELRLRTYVNGVRRQDGSPREWIFPLPRLLAFLSNVMTLEPGDVVSTGTPAGVGLFQRPPIFLEPGDVVRLEIDRIGALENPVGA